MKKKLIHNPYDKSSILIVLFGNLKTGLKAYGPFNDEASAYDWVHFYTEGESFNTFVVEHPNNYEDSPEYADAIKHLVRR